MAKRQFGVSTRLYQAQRLGRSQLLEIAAFGFETVEIVAAPGHFDPSHEAGVADLQQWLAEAGLGLHAIVAAEEAELAEQALFVARRIPVQVLILPVGPVREAARVTDRLAELAAPLGVVIAVDSRSPSMTPIGSLVHFVERSDARLGIALDFATAAKAGRLVDAVEMAAEHLAAARVPAESGIDWAAVMTTVQKIGYEGAFIVDAGGPGPAKEWLARARNAREKMERWLTSI